MKKIVVLIILIFLIAVIPIHLAVSGGGGGSSAYTRTFNEEKLLCKQTNVGELVRCRYDLEENYEQLNYLPAECSVLTQKNRDDCLDVYEAVQPCWKLEGDPKREACFKQKIGISSIRAEKELCEELVCLYDLRNRTYSLVKIRMYNLEEKAEELEELGVDKELIIDVIVMLEESKIEFNQASNMDKRIIVVQSVNEKWEAFKEKVVEQLKENGFE